MTREAFRRAISYPYEIPARSYVVARGRHEELAASATEPDLSGRKPILAVGSNQSPEQLIRKFGDALDPIPVIRAALSDFDIVYSPHVSSYGSIPATLARSPGTRVTLYVTWLTPPQEAQMHETEVATGNYLFGRLDDIKLKPETGSAMTSVFVYSSRRGALLRNGVPVALTAVRAENRRWPGLSQEEVQTYARDRLAPGQALESFVMEAIDAAATRRTRTQSLMVESTPFDFAGFTPIDV